MNNHQDPAQAAAEEIDWYLQSWRRCFELPETQVEKMTAIIRRYFAAAVRDHDAMEMVRKERLDLIEWNGNWEAYGVDKKFGFANDPADAILSSKEPGQ